MSYHVLSWNSNINMTVLNIQPIWVHGYMGLELYTSTLFLAIFKSQLQVLPLFSLEPWLDSTERCHPLKISEWKKIGKKNIKTQIAETKKSPNQNMSCFLKEFPRFPFLVLSHHFKYSIHSWKFLSHLRHTVIMVSGAYEHTNALKLIPIKLEPTWLLQPESSSYSSHIQISLIRAINSK